MHLLAALLLCATQGQDYYPPPDNAGGWRTLTVALTLSGRTEEAGTALQRLTELAPSPGASREFSEFEPELRARLIGGLVAAGLQQ